MFRSCGVARASAWLTLPILLLGVPLIAQQVESQLNSAASANTETYAPPLLAESDVWIRGETGTVVAGEPLFLTVTVRNSTNAKLFIRTEPDAFARLTIGPDGSRTPSSASELAGLPIVLHPLQPDEEFRFVLLAPEVSSLRDPGDYRMTVETAGLGTSSEVLFSVLPYNPNALRQRAEDLFRGALAGGAARRNLDLAALAAMDQDVAEPFLCELLRRTHGSIDSGIARQLGEQARPGLAACLVEILPESSGLDRLLVEWILSEIAARTDDAGLRRVITNALGEN